MSYCLSFEEIKEKNNHLLIAIKKYDEKQFHVGIYYKTKEDDCGIFNFLTHCLLRKSKASQAYKYIQINALDDDDVTHMITHIKSIFSNKNNHNILYGPCGGGDIDSTGEYIGDDATTGLTCSLFVLKTFQSQGIMFINDTLWPIRLDDKKWQLDMLNEYCREPDLEELYIAQERLIGNSPRFRPEEVGASVTFNEIPNIYKVIEPVSLDIKGEL